MGEHSEAGFHLALGYNR